MDRRQSVWNTLNLETAKLHASNSDLSPNRQKSSRRKRHTTVSITSMNCVHVVYAIINE